MAKSLILPLYINSNGLHTNSNNRLHQYVGTFLKPPGCLKHAPLQKGQNPLFIVYIKITLEAHKTPLLNIPRFITVYENYCIKMTIYNLLYLIKMRQKLGCGKEGKALQTCNNNNSAMEN